MFWAGFLTTLGLAHVHVRLLTRGYEIERARLQAEWDQVYNQANVLRSEVSRLRESDVILEYAYLDLNLVKFPADQIQRFDVPEDVLNDYDRTYSEIALARRGTAEYVDREPLVARVLGTILWPDGDAQARSADLE